MIHRRTLWLGSSLLLWGGTIVEGFKILEDYAATPGFAPSIHHAWPADTLLPSPPAGQSNVILFIHPRCRASHASLVGLGRLLAQTQPVAKTVSVVFVASARDPVPSELWRHAEALPGVSALTDDGTEARRFGATDSGHLFVYDERGQLAFTGGITDRSAPDGTATEKLQVAVNALATPESAANRAGSPRGSNCGLFEAERPLGSR